MRIIDKYKKLQDEKFVLDMISKSVFGTMQLEQQGISMTKVRNIVRKSHKLRKKVL